MWPDLGWGTSLERNDLEEDARRLSVEVASVPGPPTRNFIYSPEMNLLAESELTYPREKAILYEYIWFNGHPVAQVDVTAVTHWTFTDHLGTPLIQTDAAGAVWWRAEYEPYGKIYAFNPPGPVDQHQPLRLPGQEAEQLNLGMNGSTERSYNIFRWYRATWGRYTQADPIGLVGGLDTYAYAFDGPLVDTDRNGLLASAADTCFLCTIFAEARGTPAPCQWAVASVIVNRLGDARAAGIPTSVCDVVSKPGAFAGYGNANYANCVDCRFPADDGGDFNRLILNFRFPFPVDPSARFYGSKPFGTDPGWNYFEARLNPSRKRGHFDRVPFPACPQFRFYNETR